MKTNPYSVSVVYQSTENYSSSISTTKTMLRAMLVDAVSEDEALGMGLRLIPEKDRTVKNGLMVTYAVLKIEITDDKQDGSETEEAV